jgi:uncharacterized protein YodC (DUF2158 family)
LRFILSEEVIMSNVTELRPGDVVYLKGGSPYMTVAAIENGQLTAAWHEGGEPMETTLPADRFELKSSN